MSSPQASAGSFLVGVDSCSGQTMQEKDINCQLLLFSSGKGNLL